MDYDDGYETRTDDIEIWKSVNLIGFFVRPKALGQHNSLHRNPPQCFHAIEKFAIVIFTLF